MLKPGTGSVDVEHKEESISAVDETSTQQVSNEYYKSIWFWGIMAASALGMIAVRTQIAVIDVISNNLA